MAIPDTSNKCTGHLAYLAREEFEEGRAYRAGLLIIDQRGTPREFRCTSPIRPNAVQRITYGDSLEPYMLVELMGLPLLHAARETFDVVFVNEPTFLNMREHVDSRVVYLRRQGEQFTSADTPEDNPSTLLDSPTGRFAPVVVETFRGEGEDIEVGLPLLQRAAVILDVLEPFERIQRALARIHDEQTLDQD